MTPPTAAGELSRVAILGGGAIGASWAALLSAHGYEVQVFEPSAAAQACGRQLICRQCAHEPLGFERALFPDRNQHVATDTIIASCSSSLQPSPLQPAAVASHDP